MTLVLIEVADEATVENLRKNKDVHVVGIITNPTLPVPAPPSGKWAGALAGADTAAWDKHLQEIRNEWERDI